MSQDSWANASGGTNQPGSLCPCVPAVAILRVPVLAVFLFVTEMSAVCLYLQAAHERSSLLCCDTDVETLDVPVFTDFRAARRYLLHTFDVQLGELAGGQVDAFKELSLSTYEAWIDEARIKGQFTTEIASRTAAT